jgi:hypothetical protein
MSDYVNNCTFNVGNIPTEYVDSFEHLCHVITNQLTDILKRRSDLLDSLITFQTFFNKLSSLINRLFRSYCMSLYGSELWLLSNDQINDLCVSWWKSLHRTWGLPYNSRCYLLPLLSVSVCLYLTRFVDAP